MGYWKEQGTPAQLRHTIAHYMQQAARLYDTYCFYEGIAGDDEPNGTLFVEAASEDCPTPACLSLLYCFLLRVWVVLSPERARMCMTKSQDFGGITTRDDAQVAVEAGAI